MSSMDRTPSDPICCILYLVFQTIYYILHVAISSGDVHKRNAGMLAESRRVTSCLGKASRPMEDLVRRSTAWLRGQERPAQPRLLLVPDNPSRSEGGSSRALSPRDSLDNMRRANPPIHPQLREAFKPSQCVITEQ